MPDRTISDRTAAAGDVASASDPSAPGQVPLIVGIGASAGGLAAFKSFFANMPADSGMAFVLVQHLDPHHKSLLAELIARQTEMSVSEAEDGAQVIANRVFVVPPDATLTISGGVLRVARPAPPRHHRWPIDAFFSSLAEDQGENAVCIVLSGTGSDGSHGLRLVKEHGGLTLAQSEYDHLAMSGMPQSAAATGLVDHVMPVEEMPALLLGYHRHLLDVAGQKDDAGTRLDAAEHLVAITALLRAGIGHDFSQYKQNTLLRRIQRRMQVLQIDTVPDFIARLKQEPKQLDLLFRELLIGVTQFFRDPPAFETLQATTLPGILDDKEAGGQLRVWVAGCATGEEVYSIAILLKEEMERRKIALSVQIFGTDIDETAIATARAGRYAKIMTGMSRERIARWFVEEGEGYLVVKEIREMCVFSIHSLVRDAPFSKMDLISCRNLLIYLDSDLQERAIRIFHYGLRPSGILFLGPSEGVTRNAHLFDVLDRKHRLFRRRDAGVPTHFVDFPHVAAGQTRMAPAPLAGEGARGEDRIDKSARLVLEKHSPAYLVINKQHEIVRFSGGETGRYLEPSSGTASLNLFAILRKALRPAVRAGVQKAFAAGQPVARENVSVEIEGQARSVTVIVEPLGDGGTPPTLCVVAFQDSGRVAKRRGSKGSADVADAAVKALEQELGAAKVQLQAAIDEAETAAEDMKSTGEEYQSVNEELQSTNEEFETAKEEMQSINEELQTVNMELSAKNDLLTRLNSDMQNLLESTEIATIFLDDQMRIKGFTPGMTALFHLRDADRARPLTDIVSRLGYRDLETDVATVLRKVSVIEREVQLADSGATFIMRIRPYRTLDRRVDGVVITFVDITARKDAEDALREHAAIVEFADDALIGLTLDGIVRSWNPSAERLFGYAARRAVGQPFSFLVADDRVEEQKALLGQARAGKIAGPIETPRLRRDGSEVAIDLTVVPIRGADGAVTSLAAAARDIAERKLAETHRTLLLHELSHRVKNVLASVQSIALQTLRTVSNPDAFPATFVARIMALSNTHDLLTRSEWQGAALRDVIEAELAPYQNDTRSRWTVAGADIQLDAKTALALGMAMHELATNAAKYGALSVQAGQVEVNWRNQSTKTGSRLHLSWIESGGPHVAQPTRKGFGTRLIAEGLALELDGDVRIDFDPAGVRCTVDVPLRPPESVA